MTLAVLGEWYKLVTPNCNRSQKGRSALGQQ